MIPDLKGIEQLKPDTLLTPAEIGRLLGLTADAIIKRLVKGQLKGVRVAGKWYCLGSVIKGQVQHQ